MAWGWVQSASAQNVSVTTLGVAFGTALSSGTKIVVSISTDQAGTANFSSATVKDGNGNSFTQMPNSPVAQDAGSNGAVAAYFLDTPAADVGTFATITLAGLTTACAITMIIEEWSGLLAGNTSACLDGSPGTSGATGSGNIGPPSYTSHASNELLLYLWGDDGNGIVITGPSGYTWDPKSEPTTSGGTSSTNSNIVVNYKNSTNGTETGQYDNGASTDYALLMVAFKLPGGGPVTPGGPFYPRPANQVVTQYIRAGGPGGTGSYTG